MVQALVNNITFYIGDNGVEFRRTFSPDRTTARDEPVTAAIQATAEWIAFHAADDAIPVATQDVLDIPSTPEPTASGDA